MKVLFLSALVLGALSAAPHKFRAESAFICNLCKSYSAMLSVDNASMDDCMDGRGRVYPVCKKLENEKDDVKFFLKTMSPEKFCQEMGACEVKTIDLGVVERKPAMCPKMIEKINAGNHGWTAGVNARFANSSIEDVRKVLGAIVDPDYVYRNPLKEPSTEKVDLPTNFDSRENWSQCKDVIGRVRDQSACGSCWAFGSTEALNDRRCIKDGDHTVLGAADTMECCSSFGCGFSQGCNGGQPGAAWNWFTRTGVVTGADYADRGRTDTCLPYPFAPCAHHVKSPSYPDCPSGEYKTPACRRECTNSGYSKSYGSDKIKASKAYDVRGVSDIMQDIYTYGTVTAAFTVYADFPTYKSGVYKRTSNQALGGHAVKIIGWGEENGTPYWLVVNSWNNSWGDQGLFKILKGQNECGIESQISAGRA